MSKINRRDLCPCGSGKKAKKCYYNPDPYNNNCRVFLTEKSKEYVPFIQQYLDDCIKEITQSLIELDKIKAIRSQTSLLIILVDLSSKIWIWFTERNPATNENIQRMKDWFNYFVYTERNKYWKDNGELHKFTAEDFVNLRNSLLHKFALPKDDSITGKSIILNNNSSHKLAGQFKEKHVLLSPLELMNLIREGYVLMIDEMKKDIKSIEYLKGINYIGLQLHKEGAVVMKGTEVNKQIFTD